MSEIAPGAITIERRIRFPFDRFAAELLTGNVPGHVAQSFLERAHEEQKLFSIRLIQDYLEGNIPRKDLRTAMLDYDRKNPIIGGCDLTDNVALARRSYDDYTSTIAPDGVDYAGFVFPTNGNNEKLPIFPATGFPQEV